MNQDFKFVPSRDLKVFAHPYKFRGCERPHGFQYCLRSPDGKSCLEHGLVFGDWPNIMAELWPDMPEKERLLIPLQIELEPMYEPGTCQDSYLRRVREWSEIKKERRARFKILKEQRRQRSLNYRIAEARKRGQKGNHV